MDDELAALLNQLHSAVGTSTSASVAEATREHAAADAPFGGTKNAAEGDDDDDDDLMAELKALRRNNAAQAAQAAAPPQVVVAGAARPVSSFSDTSALLLARATREHAVLLGAAALAEKAARTARYQAGDLAGPDRSAFEAELELFAPQLQLLAQEQRAASDVTGELVLRPASSNALVALATLNTVKGRRDSAAWLVLLDEMREVADTVPVSRTRHLWQRLLTLCPSQAQLAAEYLQLEIAAETEIRTAALNASNAAAFRSTVAEDPIVTRLRILDIFHRHLPLCVGSSDVSRLFVTYARALGPGEIDDLTLKELVEASVERVGRCMDAAPLWRALIEVYQSKFSRHPQYLDWVRAAYHQWLSTPMRDLTSVAAEYSAFELGLRPTARLRLQSHLEAKFKLAQMQAATRIELWSAIDANFLPLPYTQIDAEIPVEASNEQQHKNTGRTRRPPTSTPIMQWQAWCRLLAHEADVSQSGMAPHGHALRFAFVLQQRLCWFPDVPACWLDLARHCSERGLHNQADAAFRRGLATVAGRHVGETGTSGVPNTLLSYAYADFLALHRNDAARGNQVFVDLVRGMVSAINGVLSSKQREGELPSQDQFDALQRMKAELAAHCCQWMSWARYALRDKGTAHIRAVAYHAITKCQLGRSPTFLKHWIECEATCATAAGLHGVDSLVSGAMDSWLNGCLVALSRATSRCNKLMDEIDMSAPSLLVSRLRDAQKQPFVTPRACVAIVAQAAVELTARAVAVVQSACCLIVRPSTNDEQLVAEFRSYVAAVSQSSGPSSAVCNSVAAACGFGPELASAIASVAPRVHPSFAASWCCKLREAASSSGAFGPGGPLAAAMSARAVKWCLTAAAELWGEPSGNVSPLTSSDVWKNAVAAHCSNGPTASFITVVLKGLEADSALINAVLDGIEVVEPALRRLPRVEATGDADHPLFELRRWLRVGPESCMTSGGPISCGLSAHSKCDDTLLDHMQLHYSGTEAGAGTTRTWESSVDVLPAHSALHPTQAVVQPDPGRWQRMLQLPQSLSAAAAAGRGFRGAGAGGGKNVQPDRIPSADDVLQNIVAGQELIAPTSLEGGGSAMLNQRHREMEENGRSMVMVATRKWVLHAGGSGALGVMASASPSLIQQDAQTQALAALLRALPTAAGCVEKFQPFISADVQRRAARVIGGPLAAAVDSDESDEDEQDEAPKFCATSDYLMQQLRTTEPMGLAAIIGTAS